MLPRLNTATMPVYTTVTANGKNAVLLNITRQPTSNTVAVANAVAAQVAQLRKKLPPGVKLELFYDQSQLVRDSIASVRDAIFIGLVLACIILFLFLRDWTSSLIAGLVIPVTIAVTIARAVAHRRELQPDDAGRAGRGHRPGDRRRHRGGRKHRAAPRRRRDAAPKPCARRCARSPRR